MDCDETNQKINLENNNAVCQVVNINAVKISYVEFITKPLYYATKYDYTYIADIEIL